MEKTIRHFYKEPQFGPEDYFTYASLYTEVANRFPDNSVFVEIGSFKGRSISYLAVELNKLEKYNTQLICVDLWDAGGWKDNPGVAKETDLYTIFLNNIKPVNDMVWVLREDSVKGAEQFKDQSVDFVFIDACHDYECVLADIKAWLPKIKPTGVIAGHDYGWHEPVRRACNDVFGKGDYTDPWKTGCFCIEMSWIIEQGIEI